MSSLSKPPQSGDDHPSPEPELPRLAESASSGGVTVPVIIGLHLRGVADDSLAVPPPPQSPTTETTPPVVDSSPSPPAPQGLAGVRKDLAEIKGSLKAGLSLLSRTGISKLTANFFHERIDEEEEEEEEGGGDDDEEEDYVPGITDEVVEFANQISARSACWTDFPLALEADFKFSDAQREHAATIEYMVPSLRALRVSLHGFMRSEQFWMVYFILLLPRLDEYDRELLSSPQVVNTRNRLLQKLQASKNEKVETSEDASQGNSSTRDEPNLEPRPQPSDPGVSVGTSSTSRKKKHADELSYFSFSDLDDDDSVFSGRLSTCSRSRGLRDPSPGGSSTEWVQLNRGYDSRGGSIRSRQSISREKDSDADSTASEWLKVYESD
ncbi:unnamed protein product [Linum trigynum]|uniref:BSD domain-containing protein n=1 Tax=Linum trigynum TaxID=586398 RepID=A0AAV2GZM9_9ROSI